jgi:hypothetical protein
LQNKALNKDFSVKFKILDSNEYTNVEQKSKTTLQDTFLVLLTPRIKQVYAEKLFIFEVYSGNTLIGLLKLDF